MGLPFDLEVWFKDIDPPVDLRNRVIQMGGVVHQTGKNEPNHRHTNDVRRRVLSGELDHDVIVKTNDDAYLLTPFAMMGVERMMSIWPDCVLHCWQAGCDQPGGPASNSRRVEHDEVTDTVYVLREVGNPGGLFRVARREVYANMAELPEPSRVDHYEGQDFHAATQSGEDPPTFAIPETGLVVEHAESTWGQAKRYPNRPRR